MVVVVVVVNSSTKFGKNLIKSLSWSGYHLCMLPNSMSLSSILSQCANMKCSINTVHANQMPSEIVKCCRKQAAFDLSGILTSSCDFLVDCHKDMFHSCSLWPVWKKVQVKLLYKHSINMCNDSNKQSVQLMRKTPLIHACWCRLPTTPEWPKNLSYWMQHTQFIFIFCWLCDLTRRTSTQ